MNIQLSYWVVCKVERFINAFAGVLVLLQRDSEADIEEYIRVAYQIEEQVKRVVKILQQFIFCFKENEFV
jgi:hypothetical protein